MPDTGATVTIPGVDIVKAGVWSASTGKVTVTPEDIAAAVQAAADPEIDKGPLKLGHVGALSNLGDSAPGLGWVDNLRASDDGTTLIGDLVDIPAALEQPIRAGFKRRSAELAWKVKTVGGKTYRMVLEGLALLGVQPPAVKGLADLAALYEPSAALSADTEVGERASLSIDDEAVRIVVNVSPDGTDLGPEFVEKFKAAFAAALDSRGLPASTSHPVPVTTPTAGGDMKTPTLNPEQIADARSKLGLAPETTDEQVVAKLSELTDLVEAHKAAAAPDGASTPPPASPAPAGEPLATSALSGTAIEQALKSGQVTVVPTAVLEQLQEHARLGADAHSRLAADQRERVLDEAMAAGKLGAGDTAATVRAQLAANLEKDFDGTKALIDALPQIVPVGQIGHDGPGPDNAQLSASDDAAWADFERSVFGAELPTPAKEA